MIVLVTGAAGFLGRHVVAELLRHGHKVLAVTRPATSLDALAWNGDPSVSVVRWDLATQDPPAGLATNIDAVIHIAAAKTGDFSAQYLNTVTATTNLLKAMKQFSIRRVIAISSLAVYDFAGVPHNSVIDENTLVDRNPASRDDYCRTKLLQEQVVRDFAERHSGDVTVLRPGLIYGAGELWNSALGIKFGQRWLPIGGDAPLPLVHVENCAQAIVLALESKNAVGATLNLIDDEQPTQRAYEAKILPRITLRPMPIRVGWLTLLSAARLFSSVNGLLPGGGRRLPGVLVPSRVQARFKPFIYRNDTARRVLGWQSRHSLDDAMDRG